VKCQDAVQQNIRTTFEHKQNRRMRHKLDQYKQYREPRERESGKGQKPVGMVVCDDGRRASKVELDYTTQVGRAIAADEFREIICQSAILLVVDSSRPNL
jgi:hypothetical protein